MRIISRRTLREFWEKYPDAEQPLKVWFQTVKKANWGSFNELKAQVGSASLIGNNRVVFNIKGNNYRLVVRILFDQRKMWIRFIGTHRLYDTVDIRNI